MGGRLKKRHRTRWVWCWRSGNCKQATVNTATAEQHTAPRAAQATQQFTTLLGELDWVYGGASASTRDASAPSAKRAVGQGATSHGRSRRRLKRGAAEVSDPTSARGSQPRVSGCFCFFGPTPFPNDGATEVHSTRQEERRPEGGSQLEKETAPRQRPDLGRHVETCEWEVLHSGEQLKPFC